VSQDDGKSSHLGKTELPTGKAGRGFNDFATRKLNLPEHFSDADKPAFAKW
jgi:hypothetical protein